MSELTILVAIAVVIVVAGFTLRVSSVFVFLGVTTGILLQAYLGESAGLALGSMLKSIPAELVADLVLLFLPILFTVVVMRRTTSRRGVLLQTVSLILIGLAAPLFMLQIMPESFQQSVQADEFGSIADKSAAVVIPFAAVLNVLLAWRVFGNRELKHRK